MKTSRPIEPKDVVRIIKGEKKGCTGVVVKLRNAQEEDEVVAVVITGSDFDHGIWFSTDNLKRIGRTK